MRLSETTIEEAALAWLGGLGFTVKHGPDILAGEPATARHPIYT